MIALVLRPVSKDDILTTYSDQMTVKRAMVLVAMAFLWTASQIPLYFVGVGLPSNECYR